jgi:hypothetical protein
MPDMNLQSALLAEHEQLRRQTQELTTEHQRLLERGATRAERVSHRMRLRDTRLELEEHYSRLRQLAEQKHLERQRALPDEAEPRSRD